MSAILNSLLDYSGEPLSMGINQAVKVNPVTSRVSGLVIAHQSSMDLSGIAAHGAFCAFQCLLQGFLGLSQLCLRAFGYFLALSSVETPDVASLGSSRCLLNLLLHKSKLVLYL